MHRSFISRSERQSSPSSLVKRMVLSQDDSLQQYAQSRPPTPHDKESHKTPVSHRRYGSQNKAFISHDRFRLLIALSMLTLVRYAKPRCTSKVSTPPSMLQRGVPPYSPIVVYSLQRLLASSWCRLFIRGFPSYRPIYAHLSPPRTKFAYT